MSEAKFTPGEWRAVKRERIGDAEWQVCWSDAGECVCDVVYQEADAKLMAASKALHALAMRVAEHFEYTDAPMGVEARRILKSIELV